MRGQDILHTLKRLWWVSLWLAGSLGTAHASGFGCDAGPIRLGFYEYGYFYFDGGKGIDHDIVEELAKRTGCQFESNIMARARIWSDLASGNLDMSVSGIRTPERDQFAWFAMYLSMKNVALIPGAVARTVGSAKAFIAQPTLRFGVVRSFRHGEVQDAILESLRKDGRVDESTAVDPIFRKLREGRIEGMFSQAPVYRKYFTDLGFKDIAIQDWAPADRGVPHGLILSKKRFSQTEYEKWQGVIDKMRADGTLKRIYLRYLPEPEVRRLLDF